MFVLYWNLLLSLSMFVIETSVYWSIIALQARYRKCVIDDRFYVSGRVYQSQCEKRILIVFHTAFCDRQSYLPKVRNATSENPCKKRHGRSVTKFKLDS